MQIYTLQSPQSSDEEEDLYYVGRTHNIVDRFLRHQTGKGAKCLVGRKNIVMVQLQNEVPFLELTQTLKLMQQHGISKVRGGPFVRWKHSEEDIATIKKLIDSEMQARDTPRDVVSAQVSPREVPVENPIDKIEDEANLKRSREDDSKLARHGMRWTPQEVVLLRDCALEDSDVRIQVLVKKFQRTPDAINSKMHQILSNTLKTSSLADVSVKLKRSESELQDILDKKRDQFLL